MRRTAVAFAVLSILGLGVACSSSSTGSDSNLRAECASRADSFESHTSVISDVADDINPFDSSEVRALVRQGRSVIAEGRSLLSDCGSLISASQRAEFSDALDEVEESVDTLDAIYG